MRGPNSRISERPMESDVSPNPSLSASERIAPLWRRLLAMAYDSVLLLSVLIVASGLHRLLVVYPYELIFVRTYPSFDFVPRTLFQLYLLAIVVAFFGYFWTHGGQTLGMRAWRLRLVRQDGGSVSLRDALRRLAWALPSLLPAGLGLLWCLIDRDGLAWHDRKSGTRPVVTQAR